MRVEGVAGADSFEVEDEPVAPSDFDHAIDPGLRFACGGAVFLCKPFGIRARVLALAWGRGVELERAPNDFDRLAMREARERFFEMPLADVAPGACDVGPDVDTELLHDG